MASLADEERPPAQAPAPLDEPPLQRELEELAALARLIFDVPASALALAGDLAGFTPGSVEGATPSQETSKNPPSPGWQGRVPRTRVVAGGDFSTSLQLAALCEPLLGRARLAAVPDATDDPRLADHPLVEGEPHLRFVAAARLLGAGGTLLGTLCVAGPAPLEAEPRQLEALRLLTRQAVALLEARQPRDPFEPELFMGMLGHDLRNPLAAIGMAAGHILRHASPEEGELNARSALQILHSVERMSGLVRDLLDVTRCRLGAGLPVSRRPASLRTLCAHALDELSLIFPHRQVELDAQGEGQGLWDPDRLLQLTSNLIANALQHSPEDTRVEVAILEQEREAVLRVHNRGPKLAPEALASMFEPFARPRRESGLLRSEGLGLGLFIVHEIAAAHGGSVEVCSSEALGTTFTVRLPRAP